MTPIPIGTPGPIQDAGGNTMYTPAGGPDVMFTPNQYPGSSSPYASPSYAQNMMSPQIAAQSPAYRA